MAPENAIHQCHKLTCCDTEIWLTLRVLQLCVHVGFNQFDVVFARTRRPNLISFPTILRRLPDPLKSKTCWCRCCEPVMCRAGDDVRLHYTMYRSDGRLVTVGQSVQRHEKASQLDVSRLYTGRCPAHRRLRHRRRLLQGSPTTSNCLLAQDHQLRLTARVCPPLLPYIIDGAYDRNIQDSHWKVSTVCCSHVVYIG